MNNFNYPRRDWMPGNTPELSPFNVNYSSVSPIIIYGYPLPLKQGGYGPIAKPEFAFVHQVGVNHLVAGEPQIYPFDEFEKTPKIDNKFILPHNPRMLTGKYKSCYNNYL
jgi:hypothetical protein